MNKRLGSLISDKRRLKGFTQQEVAQFVGMTRENFSSLETGRRKDPLSPEQSNRLSKLLDIPVVTMLEAMGYQVEMPGFDDEEEVALVQAYRRLSPIERRMLRAAAGLPSAPSLYRRSDTRLRRLAETDPQPYQDNPE